MSMRHWLIVYDIADPKRLQKVAKLLSSYATRVQKSVFEAEAEYEVIETIREKANRIIHMEEDFIVYFDLCEQDWQKRKKYGLNRFESPDLEPFVIL